MNIVEPVRTWWKNHEGWIAVGAFAVGVFAIGAVFGAWQVGVAYQRQADRLDIAHAEAIKAKDELITRLASASATASTAAATAATTATEQAVQATDEAKAASEKSAQAAQTAQVAVVHAKAASADARAVKGAVSDAMRAATKPEHKP